MKRKITPGYWKMRVKGIFSRPLVRFASLFKEPRKLWVVFSLRLSLVLSLATLIPILVLYILSKWGYIEASQELDFGEPTVEPLAIEVATPDAVILNDVFEPNGTEIPSAGSQDMRTWLPVSEPGLPIEFDPETGTWQIDAENARFVFSSNIFRFRVDVPAWIAIGSLPLLSLMIGVLLSIWMSRGVTRPFSRLAEAAHAIGRRDLGYRVQTEGSQELVDLAQSFNRMADELEKAESVRRNLMADVAHELRTPLTVLDGNLRAMLDGVHPLNEAEIALLYEQTHHLNRLVDDLRELSLAEADQLSLDCHEVDLVRLVRETAAHFDSLAVEQGIQLTSELDEPLFHPCLDENRIRQVLHNLLSNAFRYTSVGGEVKVAMKRLEETIQIVIADSGDGISPQDLPYIFDRFYRTDQIRGRDRGGSGLGLAISKAILEAQGGSIDAQSPGKGLGSTFTIRLPVG